MTTYDLLLIMVLVVWWLLFRKKYYWKGVLLFYFCGVMLADIFCAILIAAAYRNYPDVLRAPALLMPIGGLLGLAYGVGTNKVNTIRLFSSERR